MNASAEAILRLRGVGKRFPGVRALQGVSLEVEPGEAHVLVGENGAGKSTLINLLAGVYVADEGEIRFDGRPYRPRTPVDAYRAGIRVVRSFRRERSEWKEFNASQDTMIRKQQYTAILGRLLNTGWNIFGPVRERGGRARARSGHGGRCPTGSPRSDRDRAGRRRLR